MYAHTLYQVYFALSFALSIYVYMGIHMCDACMFMYVCGHNFLLTYLKVTYIIIL